MPAIGMLLTLSLLVVAVSVPSLADVVSFPDPGLEAAIRDALAKPTGDVLDTDLVGLASLNAVNQNIVNLEGIQYCSDLEHLWLDRNEIVDISPLSDLTNLSILALSKNPIIDISPLSGLINLLYLDLSGNQIVDISPLSCFTTLKHLYLHDNLIIDISALSGLTNLKHLWLGVNYIVDISPLANLTNLAILDLHDNRINDITVLVENVGLGEGDSLDICHNSPQLLWGPLLKGGAQDIEALRDRGVEIHIGSAVD